MNTQEKRWIIFGFVAPLFLLVGGLSWQWYKSVPDVDTSAPPMPSPNAYYTFTEAGEVLRLPPNQIPVDIVLDIANDEAPPPNTPAFRERYPPARREFWLQTNKPFFDLFQKALRQKYQCPVFRKYERFFPERFGDFRSIGRALQVKIHANAERKQWNQAAQTALDLIQFGVMVPQCGDISAFSEGRSLEIGGRKELWALLSHLDARTASQAARRLENLEKKRVSLPEDLKEEKWAELIWISGLVQDPPAFASMAFSSGPTYGLKEDLLMKLSSPRLMLRHYAQAMDKTIAEATQPYDVKLKELDEHWPSAPPQTLSDPLTSRIYPNYIRRQLRNYQQRAERNLLLGALALRAFRLEQGRYPQKLDELVPRYLSHVPDDPFHLGHALGYKLQPTKFLSRVDWLCDESAAWPAPNSPVIGQEYKAIRFLYHLALHALQRLGRRN